MKVPTSTCRKLTTCSKNHPSIMEPHCRIKITPEQQLTLDALSQKCGVDLTDRLLGVTMQGERKFCYPNGILILKLTGKPGTNQNKLNKKRYLTYSGGIRCLCTRECTENGTQVITMVDIFDETDSESNDKYRTELGNYTKASQDALLKKRLWYGSWLERD